MANKNTTLRLGAAVVIIALAAAAYVMRPAADRTEANGGQIVTNTALPRLLDLGADRCVPCKLMAPILDEMKAEFAGVMKVDFIDVWKDPTAAQPYEIRVIPTQIFFAPDGTELYRHEGFYGRDEILAKWLELGVTLPEKGV